MSRRRKIKAMTLDQLDHWLQHEADLSWKNISISEVDGFLAAMIVGPTFIAPEVWMRAIFGTNIPGAYGEPKGEAAIQAIVERHNDISTTLAERPEDYAPILFREDNGTVHPEYWADGFWQGMTLNMPDWAPLMKVENQAMFLPIMLYCLDRMGVTEDDIPRHIVEPLAQKGWRQIPEAVAQIRTFFMPTRVKSHKS